jgi:hypothetical protein
MNNVRSSIALAVAAIAVPLAAQAAPPAAGIPDALRPAAGEAHALTVAARGVQVYECRATANGAEWTFVAPEAELFDAAGRPAGTHGAGPVWQANDGSRIVGSVKARADAPVQGAIPWLLLATRSTGPQGLYSRVTSIQRVNTSGGVAPATGCGTGTVGATAKVPYTADYRLFAGEAAATDAVSEWNVRSAQLVADAKLGTPPAVRLMATVQTAVLGAVEAAAAKPGTSVDAAVAAAHRTTMAAMLPAHQAAIEAAYQQAVSALPDGAGKTAGIALGEQAAKAVLAARAGDTLAAEAYRPSAVPGSYVPTALPAAPQWQQRKPWTMAAPSQFRPGPPPALSSEAWARDYNEVKALGGKTSTQRTDEQTEIARFWDYSLPAVYLGTVRSVAVQPGRDVVANARLFAAAAQAMDDALISVFDAKYHHHFWRPVTAIRNGDADGHDGTERDAAWSPLIDVPLHPEYPSAHAALAGAVGAVLKAELAGRAVPILSTRSPTAKAAPVRHWTGIDELVREVGDARIYEGVHFRTSTDVGTDMGRRIGEQAVTRVLQAAH